VARARASTPTRQDRRHPDAARSAFALRLDPHRRRLVFRSRSAYEFGVNPVGVKTDRYYFNDGQSDDSWDAVWDVQVERTPTAGAPSSAFPFSQLRFNNTSGGPVGFSIMREVGRLAETSTWPLLSRNANGFVSQFGELRGLKMSGAPKRFELMPYSLGKVDTRQVDASDRSHTRPIRRLVRSRHEVRGDPGPDADGDGESGLRPGRSRSRGRQPRCVRDVLPRAPAVLR
jgi:hypothetical protein